MNPQLLIFDLDGTLIDSRADLAAAINHMRAHYDLTPLTLETVSGFVGDGARRLVERSLANTGLAPEEPLRVFKTYYSAHLTDHTRLYPGISEGIPRLADAGHRMAVLTNKPGEPSRRILDHFGLSSFLITTVGGGDVSRLKPEPDGVYYCLQASGIDPSDAWMIGDHCTDLAVAQNAGIKSAYMEYGFGEPRGYKPDAYFASFEELVGYFV